MPTNRPELQLRSSSRRPPGSRRGRKHGAPSRAGDKSYAAPSGRHVKRVSFAAEASAAAGMPAGPSSVASSTAASTVTRGSAGAENVDPQQPPRRSNQPPQQAAKAASAKAAPPEVSLEVYHRTAAAPLLPFEQFRQLRRENNGRMPVLPMERSAARRDVRHAPEGAMSFDEFRAMRRLLTPPKERAGKKAGDEKGEGKRTKKRGKKKYGAGSLPKKTASATTADAATTAHQGSGHFRAVFDVFGTDAAAARASEALGGAKKCQGKKAVESLAGSLAGSPASLALPRGMPRVLTVPEDWEAQAGFAFDKKAVRDDTRGGEAGEEEAEEEEIDPRNASTWVVCDSNEGLDEDDATEDRSPDAAIAKTPTKINEGERLSLELGVEVDDRLGEFSPLPSCQTAGDETETGSRLDALLGMHGREGEFGGECERHLGSARWVLDEGRASVDIKEGENRAEKYRREMHEKEEKMIRAAKKAGRKARKSLNGKIDAVLGVDEVARKSRESLNLAPARETKGRVLLVRVRRKISRLSKAKGALKKLLGKFPSNQASDAPAGTELVTDVKLFVPAPRPDGGPLSPSAFSVLSVASSVVDRHGMTLLGATPVKSGLIPPELLYGAIDYASTYDGDELPSPPAEATLQQLVASKSADEEDAVSYLAAAMRNYGSEEGGMLLLTPRGGAAEEANGGDANNHGQALVQFSAEDAGIAPGTPLQIVDALEVEGGYLLTPSGKTNEGAAGIFRFSTNEMENLLPDSDAGSDSDEDEEEALLFVEDAPALKVEADCNATVVAADPSDDSPSNASHFIGDIKLSAKKPKKKSPKAAPKSASKTRGGLVKGRIGALQLRLAGGGATAGQLLSTAASFDGSFRSSSRRGGQGYIRSVPIGIANTYSRESVGSGSSIGPRDGACYAQKYTVPHPVRSVPIGIAKSYSRDSSDGLSTGYARSFEGREE